MILWFHTHGQKWDDDDFTSFPRCKACSERISNISDYWSCPPYRCRCCAPVGLSDAEACNQSFRCLWHNSPTTHSYIITAISKTGYSNWNGCITHKSVWQQIELCHLMLCQRIRHCVGVSYWAIWLLFRLSFYFSLCPFGQGQEWSRMGQRFYQSGFSNYCVCRRELTIDSTGDELSKPANPLSCINHR